MEVSIGYPVGRRRRPGGFGATSGLGGQCTDAPDLPGGLPGPSLGSPTGTACPRGHGPPPPAAPRPPGRRRACPPPRPPPPGGRGGPVGVTRGAAGPPSAGPGAA